MGLSKYGIRVTDNGLITSVDTPDKPEYKMLPGGERQSGVLKGERSLAVDIDTAPSYPDYSERLPYKERMSRSVKRAML